MAKTAKKAGKRRTTAVRSRLRAGKAGVSKARKGASHKPKPPPPAPRPRKTLRQSETARLMEQLKTARLRLEASAEILRAVANAAGDVARPLQQIAETTSRLFGAQSVAIQLAEGKE